jgi:2-methylcitrate dehydratase PrpD
MLTNAEINAASDMIHITENEDYERAYPARSLARVTITLNDGRIVTQEVDRSERGRYLNPTDADIEGKFRLIATDILGQKKTDRVIALVRNFETVDTVSELIECLTP